MIQIAKIPDIKIEAVSVQISGIRANLCSHIITNVNGLVFTADVSLVHEKLPISWFKFLFIGFPERLKPFFCYIRLLGMTSH